MYKLIKTICESPYSEYIHMSMLLNMELKVPEIEKLAMSS
jgi:hypothetical protein